MADKINGVCVQDELGQGMTGMVVTEETRRPPPTEANDAGFPIDVYVQGVKIDSKTPERVLHNLTEAIKDAAVDQYEQRKTIYGSNMDRRHNAVISCFHVPAHKAELKPTEMVFRSLEEAVVSPYKVQSEIDRQIGEIKKFQADRASIQLYVGDPKKY